MRIDPKTIHKEILPIIQKASQIMLDAFNGETEVFSKEGEHSAVSIVTATDREVDAYLRKALTEKFPDSGFITEETIDESPSEEYVWIIDPIDGTANFANKIPIFGLSLGLWHQNQPIYGSLTFPALNESVYAAKGHGVFYNGKKYNRPKKPHKNNPNQISSLFCQAENAEKKLKTLEKLKDAIAFPQDYQSASYHFALVVLGRFDCVIIVNLPIWDFGASLIIAEEAGLGTAFVTPFPDLSESGIRDYKNSFIMAEKNLAQKIADRLL